MGCYLVWDIDKGRQSATIIDKGTTHMEAVRAWYKRIMESDPSRVTAEDLATGEVRTFRMCVEDAVDSAPEEQGKATEALPAPPFPPRPDLDKWEEALRECRDGMAPCRPPSWATTLSFRPNDLHGSTGLLLLNFIHRELSAGRSIVVQGDDTAAAAVAQRPSSDAGL